MADPAESVPPLLDALLALRRLSPAELEALLRQLPALAPPPSDSPPTDGVPFEPPAPDGELAPPPARETILVGFGEDDAPPPESGVGGADAWALPTEEETPPARPTTDAPDVDRSLAIPADNAPVTPATPDNQPPPPATSAGPLPASPTEPAEAPDFPWTGLPAPAAARPARPDPAEQQLWRVLVWLGKGVAIWLLFVASFFAARYLWQSGTGASAANRPTGREAAAKSRAEPPPSTEAVIDIDALINARRQSKPGATAPLPGLPSAPEAKAKAPAPPTAREKARPAAVPAGTVLLGRDDQPQATAIAFQDNGVVATGTEDGRLIFWNAAKGTVVHNWVGHGDRVNRLAFGADGRYLASAGNDRLVRVWNTLNRVQVRSWAWDSLSLAFSRDGRWVAAGCVDGLVRVGEVGSGEWWSSPKQPVASASRAAAGVLCVAFSPDGSALAVGRANGVVQLVDVGKRQPTRSLAAHRVVHAVAYAPDGRTLATAGKDGTIKLWDLSSGKEIRTMKDPGNQPVVGLAYHPSRLRLATASWDGVVRMWDLGLIGTVKPIQNISLPAAGFGQQLDFSPNGDLLATVHGGNPAYVIPILP